MKTTFLVRDGLTQVVLHPETPVERAILDLVSADQSVEVHRTQFAETRGGFIRQFGLSGHTVVGSEYRPDLVLVLRPEEPRAPGVEPPPETADLCKLRDGTWVYRNHAGTWQTCPSPFPPDQTYEVQQLRGEMAAILEHCVKETGFDASTKLKAIRSLAETTLARDTQHVGGGHD